MKAFHVVFLSLSLLFAPMHVMGKDVAAQQKACGLHNDMSACFRLGEMFAKGDGVPKDIKSAYAFYGMACQGGLAPACPKANEFLTVLQRPTIPAQDVELYQKECDDQRALSCFSLGVAYYVGKGVAPDPVKAADLYRRACDLGNGGGCASLGMMYEGYYPGSGDPEKEGVEPSLEKAREYYGKACDLVGSCFDYKRVSDALGL